MAVTQDFLKNQALELARYASQHFNSEELEFFKYYAMLQDFEAENEANAFQKAWDIWNKGSRQSRYNDLREDIRPARKFLAETKRAKVQSIIDKNVAIAHDEQFAILVCAQAELRQISWNLPNYPLVPLHRIPEKWWCSEGEILASATSDTGHDSQVDSVPHRPNRNLQNILDGEQSYHFGFLLPETQELYLEERVPQMSQNGLKPTILRMRRASGGKIIDPKQYPSLRQEQLYEDSFIDKKVNLIPVVICLLWRQGKTSPEGQ